MEASVSNEYWRVDVANHLRDLRLEPDNARLWLGVAVSLATGAEWGPCFDAAGQAVRRAPYQVAPWVLWLEAQSHLESLQLNAGVLSDAVILHGHEDALIAAMAPLLGRIEPDDPELRTLADGLWRHRRALEVLRLARLGSIDELALEAARWIELDSETILWAGRVLAFRPDHASALGGLLEVASKAGEVALATQLGFQMLPHEPEVLEQLLFARALQLSERIDDAKELWALHLERRPLIEDVAEGLGLAPKPEYFPGLALLAAARERQRWSIVMMAVADLVDSGCEGPSLWGRAAECFERWGRPFEADAARVLAKVPT